ncbi:Transcription-repair-coupling factor [Rubripirellula obstinata]|uniref:Transcription-repair-coupling factor n=1 Tax=Rubripirellula obstinata TaxID=406547 RepID=A0A5B1CBD2_9BACT|nr:transcription-repair coupling factor [Rubripirellula obstinata]KAA1257866.1 Transcription-repair-coupling factor [Rubripirellula obstinata]
MVASATANASKLADLARLCDESAGINARVVAARPKPVAATPPGDKKNRPKKATSKATRKAPKPLAFSGVWGSLRGVFAAALARQHKNVLMLLPQAADADIVAGDAQAFGVEDAISLPLSSAEITAAAIRDDDYAERLQVLQRLQNRDSNDDQPLLVTAFIGGALQRVPTPQALEDSTRKISVGDEIDPADIRRWLAEAGFASTTAVQLPGEFATRGGLLDIYSADQPHPIRIEWFGDEIESIRRFDSGSQRSIESVDHVEIAAVGVATSTEEETTTGSSNDHRLGSIVDYLPADTLVVIVDPLETEKSASDLVSRTSENANLITYAELQKSLAEFQTVTATALASGPSKNIVDLHSTGADAFATSLDETRTRIDTVAAGHHVILVGDTPADGERLTELLHDTDASRSGRIHLDVAQISGGFRLTDNEVLVLTGAELFHRSPVRRGRSRSRGKPINSLTQLEPGDLVVHLSYGIGLYRGLQHIEKNGQHLEHLTIEFDGGSKIYVPASRIGLVQRYVGGTKTQPRLAKIGGQSWDRQKKAAESAVTDMAGELLEMQAQRSALRGIIFDHDNEWQRQFDASFPYIETPDQVTAIAALKEDMESNQPMDRLICGDVGFGKTEVAMRAAFKAVSSGYQVAVLVPTTVLAEQHYHNFRERMAEFPVEIGKLSRFCTAAEQRETVKGLKAGRVDIVVGTHRIASKDVDFSRLGLVVVDEEQRFGVAVKERLKTLHSNVDVLTLSATPIPRTLHMALVGVRDISNLETPPAERRSVETNVIRFDEQMIRMAIVRELNRGGQIFFVHNRIADMERIASKLRDIVPEVRIGIGHGQMGEGELEQVMVDFIDHKFDLLLATTIIESGLDIPNANTIFIDDGDRYGLSDLHQLRGRVGRYKHQAYCYLLVDQHKHLSPEATKRLRAIEEFSQMGAGFAISMRDLEIRGAGNLLGSQQSGHIAAIGYELYCHLLEDAVRQIQNLPPKLTADVDIDLPVEAYLPDGYVPDLRHKIDLYRRLAKINDAAEIEMIREELQDRFGSPPDAVNRMLELAELRLDAAAWLIASITTNNRFIVLNYTNRQRIEQLAKTSTIPIRVVDHKKAYIPTTEYDMNTDQAGTSWLQLARAALHLG